MALSYGFYNSVTTVVEGQVVQDRLYDAIQMSQIFDGIISDGVYATYKKGFVVKSSTVSGQIIVQPGRAWFNHTWTYNDADMPVEAPDPEVILDRIDALVIDINSDLAYRENKITWVTGTPSSQNPARPTLAHTNTHNQYALCYVHRYGDTYEIKQDDITNVIGTSETPFVTGIIDTINVDDLLLQWTAQFETFLNDRQHRVDTFIAETEADFFAWMESEKTDWYQWLSDNRTYWNNWFSHIQTELDGDVAGHLQNEIDNISFIYVINETLFLPMTAVSVNEQDERATFINLNNS